MSNWGSDTLSIVDLGLNVEVRQIPTGRDPRHMAVTKDGLSAFVCIWGDGIVAKLDLAGLQADRAELVSITDIDIGRTAHPYSAAVEPRRAGVRGQPAGQGPVGDRDRDR